MKTKALLDNSVLTALFLTVLRQACGQLAGAVAADTPTNGLSYVAANRGGNYTEWQRTEQQTNRLGRVIARKLSYTELGDGLHYVDSNGNWADTVEEITLYSDASGASATNGPHRLYLPADIYHGVIEIVGPDGQVQRSRPMGIAFVQGDQTVLISELTNSVGKLLPSKNQVLYENAFTDFQCDLLVTYRKRGVECDLVFRSKNVPSPSEYSLSAGSCQIQLLTEFFDTAAPAISSESVDTNGVVDADIAFGAMRMRPGTAFFVGTNSSGSAAPARPVPVYRSWQTLQGRSFLVESASYKDLLPKLAELASIDSSGPMIAKRTRPSRSRFGPLPASRPIQRSRKSMEMASSSSKRERPGVIWDYEELSGTTNSFTFQADRTYHISSTFSATNVVFEGGTVIKVNGSGEILASGSVTCKTAPYQMAVFTSKNDNSIGQTITPSSTGSPTNTDVGTFLNLLSPTVTLSYLRFSHCSNAVVDYKTDVHRIANTLSLWHCQLTDVGQAIIGQACNVNLYNVLVQEALAATPVTLYTSGILVGQNMTLDGSTNLLHVDDTDTQWATLLNCLITDRTNLIVDAGSPTLLSASPFQTVGGGNYYLSKGSPYVGAGNTNITPALYADLTKKTTHPATLIPPGTLGPLVLDLWPQTEPNGAAIPIGYSYDRVDYQFGGTALTNAGLTITVHPGTVIAAHSSGAGTYYGLIVENGSSLQAQGTVDNPVSVTTYSTVQEAVPYNWQQPNSALIGQTGSSSQLSFRFVNWSCSAQDCFFVPQSSGTAVNFQDCRFRGGCLSSHSASINLTNSLLERVTSDWEGVDSASLEVRNNLFWRGAVTCYPGNSTVEIKDNLFDRVSISSDVTGFDASYNAYVTNCDRLTPTNANDLLITGTDYRVGPLGDNYYYPTNGGMLSTLINAGSTNADRLGLYHYSTTTNLLAGLEIKETNSIVDIGWHVPAVNGAGVPVDTDGDTFADYLEDPLGSGASSAWTTYTSPNGLVTNSALQVFTPLK
jgi:hypothetical protein